MKLPIEKSKKPVQVKSKTGKVFTQMREEGNKDILHGNDILKMYRDQRVPIPEYAKKLISQQKFQLKNVDLLKLIKKDDDLREFVENTKSVSKRNVKESLPIIIGNFGHHNFEVIDGYHRVNSAIKQGIKNLRAFVKI